MITILNIFLGYFLKWISRLIKYSMPSFESNLEYITRIIIKNSTLSLDSKKNLVQALIKIEDKRFLLHSGVDFYSVFRAIYRNIFKGRLEGASTITQQLVRVIINERKVLYSRKIKEMMLASLIEFKFSKREIISAYLLTTKLANQHSLKEFCQIEDYNYSHLTYLDSIEIAARFKYPHLNENNLVRYLKRVRTIEIKLKQTTPIYNVEGIDNFSLEILNKQFGNRNVKRLEQIYYTE